MANSVALNRQVVGSIPTASTIESITYRVNKTLDAHVVRRIFGYVLGSSELECREYTMPIWTQQLSHLVTRGWFLMVTATGTNTLGFIVWTFACMPPANAMVDGAGQLGIGYLAILAA